MLLFFTVIKPSIARGVCHTEALRRDLHDFFTDPQESKRNRENMLANVDKLYQECKVYNAGKIYEDYILRDMQL